MRLPTMSIDYPWTFRLVASGTLHSIDPHIIGALDAGGQQAIALKLFEFDGQRGVNHATFTGLKRKSLLWATIFFGLPVFVG